MTVTFFLRYTKKKFSTESVRSAHLVESVVSDTVQYGGARAHSLLVLLRKHIVLSINS